MFARCLKSDCSLTERRMTANFWRHRVPMCPRVAWEVRGNKMFSRPDRQAIRAAMRVGVYPINYR